MSKTDQVPESRLVFSISAIPEIDNSSWDITNDPRDAFGAAIISSAENADEVFRQLALAGKAHCPIAGADTKGDSKDPRIDAVFKTGSAESLQDALQSLAPRIKRYTQLKNFTESADKNHLQILGTAYVRETDLNAKWTPRNKESISYPMIRGVENTRVILEDMANSNLLSRTFFDKVHTCSECNSTRLNVREECTKCFSSNIKKEPLIHHYKCGYQATESAFLNDRKLVCPKCKNELRHYGVDYDKPGEVYSCLNCSNQSSEPTVGFICMDCEHKSSAESTNTIEWYNYQLTQDGIDAVKTGVLPYRSLQSAVMSITGAYSTRDFSQVTTFLHEISNRYKRPITAFTLDIKNISQLRKTVSTQTINETMRLIAEIISQNIRNTDATTSSKSVIAVLLPETTKDQIAAVVSRIDQQIKKNISVPILMESNIYSGEKIITILEKLN